MEAVEAVEESKETIGGTGGADVRLLMYFFDGPWLNGQCSGRLIL